VGSQLYLPARWARHLESRIDPSARLAELERDRAQARTEIHDLLDRLAEKHGATPRDVSVAMRSIDDTLGDLLYDQARALQHEMEKSDAGLEVAVGPTAPGAPSRATSQLR
jgi:hypothetical protein